MARRLWCRGAVPRTSQLRVASLAASGVEEEPALLVLGAAEAALVAVRLTVAAAAAAAAAAEEPRAEAPCPVRAKRCRGW